MANTRSSSSTRPDGADVRRDEPFGQAPAVDEPHTTWALLVGRHGSSEPLDERIVILVHSQAAARKIAALVRAPGGRPLEVIEVALGGDGRYRRVCVPTGTPVAKTAHHETAG